MALLMTSSFPLRALHGRLARRHSCSDGMTCYFGVRRRARRPVGAWPHCRRSGELPIELSPFDIDRPEATQASIH